MKKVLLGLALGLSSMVGANETATQKNDVAELIKTFEGKKGTLTTVFNKEVREYESNIPCEVKIEGSKVYLDARTYFQNLIYIDDAAVQSTKDTIVVTSSEDGKRPGGSVCGDTSVLSSYKKTMEISNDSVTITEKFRCNLVSSYKQVVTCKINE